MMNLLKTSAVRFSTSLPISVPMAMACVAVRCSGFPVSNPTTFGCRICLLLVGKYTPESF